MTRDLALLSKARKMLAEATTFDEILQVENLAERARDYAKKARLGREAVNAAAGCALDARRKAGTTLREMKERGELDAGKGGDRKSRSHAGSVKLADLGLTFNQSSRYQQEASVPQEVYREWVARVCESEDGELHANGVRALARQAPHESNSRETSGVIAFAKATERIRTLVESLWARLDDLNKAVIPSFLRELASIYEERNRD